MSEHQGGARPPPPPRRTVFNPAPFLRAAAAAGWRPLQVSSLFDARGRDHVGDLSALGETKAGVVDCIHFCAFPGLLSALGLAVAHGVHEADREAHRAENAAFSLSRPRFDSTTPGGAPPSHPTPNKTTAVESYYRGGTHAGGAAVVVLWRVMQSASSTLCELATAALELRGVRSPRDAGECGGPFGLVLRDDVGDDDG